MGRRKLELKRFQGKNVIVTGATSGIGKATALLLAKEGANVIAVGRNEKRGRDVCKEISNLGGKALFFQCDLSKEEKVKELYAKIEEQFESIDLLFNNAGIWITEPLENISEEMVMTVFSSDFNSVLFMTKYFIPMLKKKHGVIINNASMGGLEGYTSGSKQYLYHSSKAAAIKFSKLTAKNYATEIRVNCICPGLIDTEIYENRDFSRFYDVIPMKRMGEAEEVAKLVAFLASEDASYITGAVIPIDGGASLT